MSRETCWVLSDGNATLTHSFVAATSSDVRYADRNSSASPDEPPCQIGPTAWMTYLAGKPPAVEITAEPVGHPCGYRSPVSRMMLGPPRRF